MLYFFIVMLFLSFLTEFLTIYKQTMEKNSYNYSPEHWKNKQEKNCKCK